jgi:large subunit ribosomal protein L3
VDLERNLLFVSGSVPGAPGGRVVIRPSVKFAARGRRKSVAAVKK